MGAGEADQRPIAALADILLRARPPSLSNIVILLEVAELVGQFHHLVEEFLPDRRQEILAEPGPMAQVAAFARDFRERYFPLDDYLEAGDIESLGDLLRGIPIVVSGYSYDDFHALPSEPLPVVLASLVVDFETEVGLEGEGIRITLLEAAEKKVPVELLDRLPFRGYPLDFLEPTPPGTRYEGALWHALMLCGQSGSVFLDTDMEELYSGGLPDWTRENVDWLTREWQKAEAIWDKVNGFYTWLEEDPERHFAELLDFLEGKPWIPPEQMALPLKFEEGSHEDRAEVGGP